MKRDKINNEFALIKTFSRLAGAQRPTGLIKGIGDDCAVIKAGKGDYLLVSTDSFNQGVHFSPRYSTYFEAGIKAATGGVSDIYAMGGRCDFIFIALSIPKNLGRRQVTDFFRGIKYVADFCGATVAGGDTTSSAACFSCTVTAAGSVRKGNLKLRSGARPGDRVYLTGRAGYSMAGLRLLQRGLGAGSAAEKKALAVHKRPMPFIRGKGIFDNAGVHAMIDISDGLSSEANHLARESGVTFELDLGPLTGDPGLLSLARRLKIPVEALVLNSGEEYALLLTAKGPLKAKGLIEIGRVEKGPGRVILSSNGRLTAVSAGGYDHFRS